jgi:hypothetical protein
MAHVTVYRVDYLRGRRVPIGFVTERRTKDRGDNVLGLARLARKLYATSPRDAQTIVVDLEEARKALLINRSLAGHDLAHP